MQNDTNNPEGKQPCGIFEPKPLKAAELPMSGSQKAKRICIAIGAILICVFVVAQISQLYFSPVRKFYRGLSKRNISVMTDAFPNWLANADMGEGNMTITDMCAALIAQTTLACGPDNKVSVSLVSKSEIDDARMQQISEGIRQKFYVDTKITKGWSCQLAVTYRPMDSEPVTQSEYVSLYQINGHWTILDVPNKTQ